MLGLAPALAEAKGKTVLDAGCAEGLISVEFARAGATHVDAFDNNRDYICEAQHNARRVAPHGVMRVRHGDVNLALPDGFRNNYDIVLALAIIHKAQDVPPATRLLAEACGGLMVIRLPHGSTGLIEAKFGDSVCDLLVEMPAAGFRLERSECGPRDEVVQYWRRSE